VVAHFWVKGALGWDRQVDIDTGRRYNMKIGIIALLNLLCFSKPIRNGCELDRADNDDDGRIRGFLTASFHQP
jgi:hypothetical protein